MRAAEAPLREQVVCALSKRGRAWTAEPFFDPGRRYTVDRVGDARHGDLVLLRLPRQGRHEGPRIVRVVGRPDVAAHVIEGLMLDRGLARRFAPGVQRAAEEARDRLAGGGHPGSGGPARRDLRGLPTFTIDPASARDFDDAISAEALPGGHRRVWVHIADVSAYVTPGSDIDREAYLRGTSVYVPGKVEPMLPEALSNDACSLKPHLERLAVTVEMDFDGADVVKASFYRSTITSDERLDYPRVDRVFAGEEPWEAPWAQPLRAAREVAAALDERRAKRGALAIETAEPEFGFDDAGDVTSKVVGTQTESHKLVEHLMIAANEQVATFLSRRKVGTLYRVHERPDPARVERLVDQLASLGVPTPPVPARMSAQQASDLVGEISQQVAGYVRTTGRGRRAFGVLVLRSLKQAHYTPEDLGHAGLRSERYCHFTSPIRRYPDLVCHRALLSAVGGGEEAPRAGSLAEAGTALSAREREAMRIERDADDIARAFLLERTLFESGFHSAWDGEVIGLIGAGAFVTFGDGYEGLLPVRRLGGDWWELNEEGTMLVGERTGTTLRLGDPLRVRVRGIEVARGRVDLELVAEDEPLR
ncbi:MAG: RNB domain-containing ribonuclease [Actinomycetota bacterium]|nr:RNB domain-containing ribonuclease [Actinomycetota bacterium]